MSPALRTAALNLRRCLKVREGLGRSATTYAQEIAIVVAEDELHAAREHFRNLRVEARAKPLARAIAEQRETAERHVEILRGAA